MVVDKSNMCEYAGGYKSPWTDKRPTLGPNQLSLATYGVFTTPTSDGNKCTLTYCDVFAGEGKEEQVECQGTFGTESNRQQVDFNFTTSDGYRTYCHADNAKFFGKEVTRIECGQPIPVDKIPKK